MDDVTKRELVAVFAANLKALRKQRNLSQTTLGSLVGVSHAAISQLESGRHAPSLEMLASLADALRVPPDALLRPEIFAAAS